MVAHGEILLKTCVTVNSANHNSRGRLLVMASLRETTKCETEKQYYKEPRHSIGTLVYEQRLIGDCASKKQ